MAFVLSYLPHFLGSRYTTKHIPPLAHTQLLGVDQSRSLILSKADAPAPDGNCTVAADKVDAIILINVAPTILGDDATTALSLGRI